MNRKQSSKKEGSVMEYLRVLHEFGPVFDEKSEILILGSFPSVKSREVSFYYGHPQNRFWKVLAAVLHQELPETVEEKKHFLLENHIAVWDVIESCDIIGSSDSSIKNVIGNDMDVILQRADIRKIYCNGEKAYQLFLKYCKREGQPELVKLPSTSPANASFRLEKLVKIWGEKLRSGLEIQDSGA